MDHKKQPYDTSLKSLLQEQASEVLPLPIEGAAWDYLRFPRISAMVDANGGSISATVPAYAVKPYEQSCSSLYRAMPWRAFNK